MNEVEREQLVADRLAASVRRALELVGPGEAGLEQVWDEDATLSAA